MVLGRFWQQTAFTGNSTQAVDWIRIFKIWLVVSENGKFDGTSMKFGFSFSSANT
jgi:hypothetical protein